MNWSSDDVPVPDPRRVATNLLLMDLYRSEVIIFLRKKIKPGARVDVSEEDILQEMYLLALQGRLLPTDKPVLKIKNYLNSIAHNQLVNRIRQALRRRESQENPDGQNSATDTTPEPDVPETTSDLTAEKITERLELNDQVQKTLARLPDVSREVLTLRYFDGLSQQQMCTRLGIRPETCAKRLQRAKKQFAALF